jgi:hypothetical protein
MVNIKVTDVSTRAVVFIEMTDDQTVGQLKSYLEGKGVGPVHRQRLAHAGRILDDRTTILDSGVVSIPSVVLSIRPISTDPTIGALATANRHQANDDPVEVEVASVLPSSNEPAMHEDDQSDVPTCRICHG